MPKRPNVVSPEPNGPDDEGEFRLHPVLITTLTLFIVDEGEENDENGGKHCRAVKRSRRGQAMGELGQISISTAPR